MKEERAKEEIILVATVVIHLPRGGEDDESNIDAAQHAKLTGLLDDPIFPLIKCDLTISSALDPLDLDLPSSHFESDECGTLGIGGIFETPILGKETRSLSRRLYRTGNYARAAVQLLLFTGR